MFYLYTVQDHITVSATFLNQDLLTVLNKLIKEKYISKILPKEGLCISFNNLRIHKSLVYPGEGDLLVSVIFSYLQITIDLLIFRPMKDEVVAGEISNITEQGIEVNIGFMKAFIPDNYLMQPADQYLFCNYSDKKERTWLWRYETTELLYDIGEPIRFKVVDIFFEGKVDEPHEYYIIVRKY